MHDPRVDQLARQLVGYSVSLKKGEKILIDLYDTPQSIGLALIREARQAGGLPVVRLNDSRLAREMALRADDAQYEFLSRHLLEEMRDVDAYIAVRGSHNIAETSDVPGERMAIVSRHLRPVVEWRVTRTKWCVLRWPNPSMAQQAGMSTAAFEDFFFEVCLVDYGTLAPVAEVLRQRMEATDEVRIKGPGTDLRFSIKGIPAIASAGTHNIPDGEVFTAPVRDSVEGTLCYNAPTIYQGIPFDSVKLTFEKGKIVGAESPGKNAEINKILDSDEGARYIGEFALGYNMRILHPMRDILFDEKIGGSFHFTPGNSYDIADNGNRSQIHWDMVCIQRPDYGGGEIWFDGKLIRKDGMFTIPELARLNEA